MTTLMVILIIGRHYLQKRAMPDSIDALALGGGFICDLITVAITYQVTTSL